MSGASSSLAAIVEQVLGPAAQPVALHEPRFAGREWEYVKECLDSGWVSSVGSYVDLFEKKLAETCGTAHAVVTVNGTAALHIALKLAGVAQGDEVMIPALTFIATANAVSYCGAMPHFAESEERSFGIDAGKLDDYLARIGEHRDNGFFNKATARRIAALVPVHIFGHPGDMDALLAVADKYGVPLVEDAAESLGSTYKGKPAGSFGLVSALSFNGNKIVTTGGGGAILTNDAAIAKRAKHLTTTAKMPHRWAFDHDEVGYNYRMPNINAALGCAQLEQLDGFVAAKRALAARYESAFQSSADFEFLKEPDYAQSNYWLNAVMLPAGADRDGTLGALHEAGYLCRPAWTLMHRLPMYEDCPRMDLTLAEDRDARIINLPSSVKLGLAS